MAKTRTRKKKKREPEVESEKKFDYSATVQQVNLVADLIRGSKIEECLSEISTSHAIAPMINPTAYMAALDPLREQTAILEAALKFQKAAVEHLPKLAVAAEKGRGQVRQSMAGLEGII